MSWRSYPRIYFELVVMSFSLFMGTGLTRAFLPIMGHELDSTGGLIGFVTSAWFISRALIGFPSGFLVASIGRRNIIVGGFVLSMLGPIICAFANNMYVLIFGIMILGFGYALFFVSSVTVLFGLFKPEKRGRAVGTFQAIENVGTFLGAPVGGILAAFAGFANVFILSSVFFFLAFLIALFSQDLKRIDVDAERAPRTLTFKEALSGIKCSGFFGVSLIQLSRMLVVQGIMFTVFQLYLNAHLSMGVELIGLVMGGRAAGMIFAAVTSGHISDRAGRKPLIIAGLVMTGVCLYLYPMVATFNGILVLTTIDGIGTGLTFTSLMVFMSEIVPQSVHAEAVAVYRTFQDIGGILGPLIFVFLYFSSNTYILFWSASLLSFANIAIVLLCEKHSALG